MRPPRSLKARALQWLAQREQSRVELRRKLMPFAVAEEAAERLAADCAERPGESGARAGAGLRGDRGADAPAGVGTKPLLTPEAAARVDAALDWLEAHQYLSQARFVESRVHARSPRFGNLRIRQELKQHLVTLPPEAAQALKDSELQRARAVRERKFGALPSDAPARAKQARFLAGRGFSPEAISRLLRPRRGADTDTVSDNAEYTDGADGDPA